MTGPEDELNEVKKGTDDDGTPVGEADRDADVRRSGTDDDALDGDASGGTGVDMPADIDRSM
jgi:hypothetical protein